MGELWVLVLLVAQFEAEKAEVDRGAGVITDPRPTHLETVTAAYCQRGCVVLDDAVSAAGCQWEYRVLAVSRSRRIVIE